MQKWNISADRAQRPDNKNGFILELWTLNCQKWLIFCISGDYSKNSVPVWVSESSFRKYYGLLSSELYLTNGKFKAY